MLTSGYNTWLHHIGHFVFLDPYRPAVVVPARYVRPLSSPRHRYLEPVHHSQPGVPSKRVPPRLVVAHHADLAVN